MAYGEFETGNLNLCEVPLNLSKEQDGELKVIKDFWEREYQKCMYVRERKAQIQKDLEERQKQEIIRKINEEKMRDHTAEAELEAMEEANEKYQEVLLLTKAKLGMISQEEVDDLLKKKGKKK